MSASEAEPTILAQEMPRAWSHKLSGGVVRDRDEQSSGGLRVERHLHEAAAHRGRVRTVESTLVFGIAVAPRRRTRFEAVVV